MVKDFFESSFSGKTVLVTGHSGFKGVWLCHLLDCCGAKVLGFSHPSTDPIFFDKSELGKVVEVSHGDIRGFDELYEVIDQGRPDYIFHLAAQAIVSKGYTDPLETIDVNVMGTANILEAVRRLNRKTVVICVASDKCYDNNEWDFGYRENDPLGGHDPYSASKGASEIVVGSYIDSYFSKGEIAVASVRSGNVIGSFDYAKDRIIPDCIKAISNGSVLTVRNAHSTRPWQHVLEPLFGYMSLAHRLAREGSKPSGLRSAFNFGPDVSSNRTVAELLDEISSHTSFDWTSHNEKGKHSEAGRLHLSSDKAFHTLGWRPTWNFEECIENTIAGYLAGIDQSPEFIRSTIDSFGSQFKLNER